MHGSNECSCGRLLGQILHDMRVSTDPTASRNLPVIANAHLVLVGRRHSLQGEIFRMTGSRRRPLLGFLLWIQRHSATWGGSSMQTTPTGTLGVSVRRLILLALFASLLPISANTQNLLNLPESVVYDAPRNRYLVSNWGSGDVVQIDSTGVQSIFLDNQQCFAGLQIVGNTLYVACREHGVKGFDLTTGENTLAVTIPGATNINDITADTSGNLYVSYPTGGMVFRIFTSSQTYSVFADDDLNTPNGIYYDEPHDRLLLISYRYSSPVQAISLEDSTVSTVVSTALHNLDGLTADRDGNFYVSSWHTNAVYRFDNAFANPPELFSSHSDDPADIYFNIEGNVLAVPLFFTHAIEFVPNESATDELLPIHSGHRFTLFSSWPNPFHDRTTLSFALTKATSVRMTVYDTKGRSVAHVMSGWYDAGMHTIGFDGSALPTGTYFARLSSSPDAHQTQRLLVLR